MMKNSFYSRILPVAGVLLSSAAILSGCGKGAKPEERRADPTAGGKAPRIVIIAGDPQSNWSAARQGALAAGKAVGAEIEWHAPTAKDPLAEQEKLVEAAIESNAAGIAIAPTDATEMVPPINKAGKKFVPAIVFDTPANTKFKLSFITSDNVLSGVLAARHVGKSLQGKGKVEVITAPPNTSGAEAASGFEETLRKEFPFIEIVAVAADATPAGEILFAPDEASSHAALKLLPAPTKLVGVGYSDDLLAALKSGKADALIVPDRYQMAYESVRDIIEYRAHRPPKLQIAIPPVLVTKETLGESQSRRVLGLE